MKQRMHVFIDWLFSKDFVLFLSELGFSLYLAVAIFYLQLGKFLLAIIFSLAWFLSACGKNILGNLKEKEYILIKNANQKLSKQNTNLQEHYNSLLRLTDTLFNAQMTALHDDITPHVRDFVRTSVYMYDSSKDTFRCLARHSKHHLFCQKNKKDEYPNKGWLQSTWNRHEYYFECDYSDINAWIKCCKEECKKNCYNSECQNNNCLSSKKEKLLKESCSMLSKKELQKKTMKAKSVWGYVLSQGSCPLGIILVEGMSVWGEDAFQKVKHLVEKYSNASLEILSLHGQQLLELLNTTDNQRDMAEGFSIKGHGDAK